MAAPKNNKNAEKWTYEEAKNVFEQALKKSNEKEYDFVGEIARDLGVDRKLFTYLSKKYEDLALTHDLILANLEANCFTHTKKGEINTAVGIVNLKSNYGWTDRVHQDNSGEVTLKQVTGMEIK